jgi:hypothetical protein
LSAEAKIGGEIALLKRQQDGVQEEDRINAVPRPADDEGTRILVSKKPAADSRQARLPHSCLAADSWDGMFAIRHASLRGNAGLMHE